VFACFARLPRPLALRAGSWLGEALFWLDAPDRRVALTNLRLAFPEKTEAERRSILRASCRNLGRVGAEFCHLPKLELADVERLISFGNRDLWQGVIDRAARDGAIILTAHFGNWELLAYVHGLLGHPITLVHRPMHNSLVDHAIDAVRSRAGTRAIAKKAAAREALRTLRRHGILVVPTDQNQTRTAGVFVNFFGVPACTNPGAVRLALLTRAPVFPVFLVRDGESERHRIEVLPEVEIMTTGDREGDVVLNTQRCSAVIEDMIRRYPEQWIWLHKRWKTRPLGEPALYT
jgi:KDO2-lipid IV(A) lauroyltransferase